MAPLPVKITFLPLLHGHGPVARSCESTRTGGLQPPPDRNALDSPLPLRPSKCAKLPSRLLKTIPICK